MAGQTGRSLQLSAQGIQKANTALLKFGSKADLAAQLQRSRTTITKFFKGEPVQQKQFRAICKRLKLILEEVADLPKTVESEPVEQNQGNGSDIDELVGEVRSRCWGKTVILLDGLDEVPSQSRRDVQDHIYKFPQQQQYYKNRFILTCRTQTTEYISDKFEFVEVAEFTPKQVEEFAKNWFKSFAETPEQGAELTEKFLNKLRLPENQPTAELAVTPILLSLTCWVFTDLKDLPAKRSDLYEQGINLLLQDWDEKRGVRRTVGSERYRNFSVSEKKTLLSYLAARKFEQEKYVLFEESEIQRYIAEYLDISIEESQEVLKAIEAHHGLLIERAQGIWSFSHLTFQEYFAAKWFCDRFDWEGLVSHIQEKHWREVFLLTAEMMPNLSPLIQLMKNTTDDLLAKNKTIQQFLTWVMRKTYNANTPYKLAAIRAFYIRHDRYVSDSLTLKIDQNLTKDYYFALELCDDIESDLGHNLDDYITLKDIIIAEDIRRSIKWAIARSIIFYPAIRCTLNKLRIFPFYLN